jgi:hypothetical protein
MVEEPKVGSTTYLQNVGTFYHTNVFHLCVGVLHYMQVMPGVHNKWVPVTTAWHILRFQIVEWPVIWWVAVNILNKQSWTAD